MESQISICRDRQERLQNSLIHTYFNCILFFIYLHRLNLLKQVYMDLLKGKVAIVTGAARGIGRMIALRFAQEGADVAFTDLSRDENMESLEKELAALGVNGKGFVSDASDYEQTHQVVDQIVEEFGKVDVLVNNAGITRDTLLMRMDEEMWDLVIKVNLKSVFNFTKAAQRYMLKARSGSIINMSSVVGVNGNAGQANYSASKAGILGFTKSVAKELGSRSVRCNAIAPGFIITDMTDKLPENVKEEWIKTIPLKRGGLPEDVANVSLFLASDLSSYMTGQTLQVCGGMSV
jgi:3-oxoacyl-[acyl-carrier protein] reductase